MGVNYQLDRVAANVTKGYRQLEKAANAMTKGKTDSAVSHYNEGLSYFDTAMDHLVKADDDASKKAGKDIDSGNKELKKSIDSYANGHPDIAANHYDKAMTSYDSALDLIS